MRSLSFVGVAIVLVPALARAAEAPGTPEAPVVVDQLPYVRAGNTADGLSNVIMRYDCAPELDESGPERVFAFEIAAPSKLTAWVEGDDGVVDVDVHIVRDMQVGVDGTATGCLARANTIAEIDAEPGSYGVVVDTFDGAAQAGAYVVHVHAIGDAWMEHPVGEGLVWRARRYPDIGGGPQVVHTVVADPELVEIELMVENTCTTVGNTVAGDPAVRAAVNSSFFSFETCGSVSLMKSEGTVLFPNGHGVQRVAFATDADGAPMMGYVPDGGEWPDAPMAQSGAGWLVSGGAARGPDDWAQEGVGGASFLGPNPRTAVGIDGNGSVVAGTFDGRRATAAGFSLEALAAFGVDELGVTELANLDGGGSSTMWIRGITPNGVVNYPSDAGMVENDDHSGSRAVVGALVFRTAEYNFAPRFQTTPTLDAAADSAWSYDADALDLNPADVVTFTLVDAPDGMTVDAATGDVAWTPSVESPPMADITLRASDGKGGDTDQTFTLAVQGGLGPADDSGGDDDTAGDDAADDTDGGDDAADGADDAGDGTDDTGPAANDDGGDDAGCSCRSSTPPPSWLVLGLVLVRRRRSG